MRKRGMVERAPPLSAGDVAYVRSLLIREEPALLAFNKPSGLPVQTRNPDDRTLDMLLRAFEKSNGKRPRLVHRLDAQTSGVIVAARTQPAAAALSGAFAKRQVQKTYLAIVAGHLGDETSGVISAPLARYRARPELELMRVARPGDEKPQEAQTSWRELARAGSRRLLEIRPRTGRMHQIRVHVASIGQPILGDIYYGGEASLGGEAIPRLMLHAWSLSGPHPEEGRFKLTAPPPSDFCETAQAAGASLGAALANLAEPE